MANFQPLDWSHTLAELEELAMTGSIDQGQKSIEALSVKGRGRAEI